MYCNLLYFIYIDYITGPVHEVFSCSHFGFNFVSELMSLSPSRSKRNSALFHDIFIVVCCSSGMNIFIVVFHGIFIGDEVLKSCGIILRFLHGVNQTFPFVISTKDGRLTLVAAVVAD